MRGSLEQRSRGSWRLKYDGPKDSNGKRKQLTETVRSTKKRAEAVLRERLAAIESGNYVPKDKETVAMFLNRWLETYTVTNTGLSTQEGYKGSIDRYVIPAIGAVPIQSLTGHHIQKIEAGMIQRGLSARTVLHMHRLLKQALSHAVKWGLVVRNVADSVTPPRP